MGDLGHGGRGARGLVLTRPFGDTDQDSEVLLHRDLHPQNVILTREGPVIIDWEGAALGPASADIAMTWVIIGFSDMPLPRIEAAAARGVQALLTRSFVRAAGPIGAEWQATALRHRLADPNLMPSEAVRVSRQARRLAPGVTG